MLFKKFEELGKDTWENIKNSNRLKIQYGEETITNTLLLSLAKLNHYNIRILQYSKLDEAQVGADWEWYVGSYKYGWIRYAIQAKKLYPSLKYEAINHKIKGSKELQIDALSRYSKMNGAIPIYCFYNHYPNVSKAHWNCSSSDYCPELLGWTFSPLKNVYLLKQLKIGKNTFDSLHRFFKALPIRCLFKCDFFQQLYFNNRTNDYLENFENFWGIKKPNLVELNNSLIRGEDLILNIDTYLGELYNSNIQLYPKRVAIIDIGNELETQVNQDRGKGSI